MKVRLFIDADTCLDFKSRGKAFVYADKNNLKAFCILTENEKYSDLPTKTTHSVFISLYPEGDTRCIQWFESENDALKCIGSFLN